MAGLDTVDIGIDDASWTDISGTSEAGFLTNFSDTVILVRQATATPSTSTITGHRINPAADSINFEQGETGQSLYGRSVRGDKVVVYSPAPDPV